MKISICLTILGQESDILNQTPDRSVMNQFAFEGGGKGSALYNEDISALIFNLQSEALNISKWNQNII